ncbi:MAG: M28 family peptidase [Bacteroidota bacterium]
MKKKIGLVFVSLLVAASSFAQNEDAIKFAETITTDDLNEYLSILASDALEGRETGKRGQKMAAAFIRSHFEELGLAPVVPSKEGKTYFQKVPLYSSIPGETYLSDKNGAQLKNLEDVIFFGSSYTGETKNLDLVFAGAGTEDDFDGLDVKDKAVVVMIDNFRAWRAPQQVAEEKGAKLLIVSFTGKMDEFNGLLDQVRGSFTGGRLSLSKPETNNNGGGGVFFTHHNAIAQLFATTTEKLEKALADQSAGKKGALKKVKPTSISYKTSRTVKTVKSENVLGYLEGSDKKDELVVITSHYDHIGKSGDQINNGADDDGSGTSSVMDIAEAFVLAKQAGKGPRRSILFMTVTGEEKGLLGSAFYAENPIFPLENTVVNLNIDMIGRIDPGHKENPNYVYLVGSDRLSSELHEISEKVNETFTQFDLDYTYNDENHPDRIYYRSDHWNFAKNNVPVIFYFNGVHEDYHRPTDTVDKIEFEILAKRAQLVFHTAWVLANRDERIVVDKTQGTELNGGKN